MRLRSSPDALTVNNRLNDWNTKILPPVTARVSRKRREKRCASGYHRSVPQQRSAPNADTKLPEAGLKLKFVGG